MTHIKRKGKHMRNTFKTNSTEWILTQWINILKENNEAPEASDGLAMKAPYGDSHALIELEPRLVKSRKWLFKDNSFYTIDLMFEGKKLLSYVQKRTEDSKATFELEKIIRFEREHNGLWKALRAAVEEKPKKHFLWGNVNAHTGTSW